MTPEDKSKIDELKKSLYSRTAPDIRAKRRLHFRREEAPAVSPDWEHPIESTEEVKLNTSYKNPSMSFFTKFLTGSVIFFLLAIGMGSYLVFNGSNIISANNIDIIVNGPVTIAGGEPVSFEVQVTNKNNIKLETVDLAVTFPAGSVDAEDRSKELKESRELMEDIVPGGVGQKTVRAVLYGEENTKREIVVDVSYRVAGSNAIFKKKKAYEVLISSSPLSLTASSFQEVTSGQEFEMEVTLTSNSADITRNLILKASYPFGFTLTSTDVKAEGNVSTWKIGDIPSQGKKTIKFKGRLEGQDDEVRVFHFTAGAQSVRTSGVIGTEYIATTKEIAIRKPFISAGLAFDNDTDGDAIGSFNTPVKATISWFNNLPSSVIDGEVRLKISGNAYDKISIMPGDGYYKSADNEIVWNKITTNSLANIGAGESGNVHFTFIPRDFSTPTKQVTSPSLSFTVNISGKRISESNVPETLTSSAERSIRISSSLNLSSYITRTGPFVNTGPLPPKAETETTYTVNWVVDNTVNTVTGAEVRALLPVYVKWLSKVSPVGEDISYNSNTGEVVWRVGSVDSFTTNTGSRRQVSFQIAFEPSVSHIGQAPPLVQDTTLVGQDDFTGVNLTSTKPALSTRFSTDSGYRDGQDIVVQ